MKVNGNRVRWEVAPQKGVFGWTLTRDGQIIRSYLFRYRAKSDAVQSCNFEFDTMNIRSELIVKRKNGRIAEKNTYGDDPRGTVG